MATFDVVGESLLVIGGEGTADEGCLAAKDVFCCGSLLRFEYFIDSSVKSSLHVGRRYGWLLFLFAPGS